MILQVDILYIILPYDYDIILHITNDDEALHVKCMNLLSPEGQS